MSTKSVSAVTLNADTISGTVDGATFTISTNDRVSLNSTTAPKAEKAISGNNAQLSSGTYSLDLTSGPDGGSLSSYYLRSIYLECPDTNTSVVRFDVGASNGISFAGASTNDITVAPGGHIKIYLGAQGEVVDSTHKIIDVTSSDADAYFSIRVTAGANT